MQLCIANAKRVAVYACAFERPSFQLKYTILIHLNLFLFIAMNDNGKFKVNLNYFLNYLIVNIR